MTRARKLLTPEEIQATFVNVNRPGGDVGPPKPPPKPPPPPNGSATSPPPPPPNGSAAANGYEPGNSRPMPGRLASAVAVRAVEWFLHDWIPQRELSFVVGVPGSGKSSFGAFLLKAARRAVVLPGYEESVEVSLVPRLMANQVELNRVFISDDKQWALPQDREALTGLVRRWEAELLWIDPIDSYVGETNEIDGPGVRAALEALTKIAHDTGCTVVCARHPGKDPRNVCPGSRQWRAVPRVIVQLVIDDGPPARKFLKLYKDPFSRGNRPREYNLGGEPGEPKRLTLGPEASAADMAMVDHNDREERQLIEEAEDFLVAILRSGEQEKSWIFGAADKERLKEKVLRKAAERLGVKYRRAGSGKEHRSYWFLPDSFTHSGPGRDSHEGSKPAPDSVSPGPGMSERVNESKGKKGGKRGRKKTP